MVLEWFRGQYEDCKKFKGEFNMGFGVLLSSSGVVVD